MKHYKAKIKTKNRLDIIEFEFDAPDNATEEELEEIADNVMYFWDELEHTYEEIK